MKKKIISVVGARPNFMKVAPLHRQFQRVTGIEHRIVHTGQHYDENMSKVFFGDLELPAPDVYLGVGSGTHAVQTAKIMMEFEKVALEVQPDLVIVVGDVNSTLACSLVAVKLCVPVAHVEAGLRSFDPTMPEEWNRRLTDIIAEHLFVTEPSGVKNLIDEGVDGSRIHLVGDVMIDSLILFREKAAKRNALSEFGVAPREFMLVTLHRPSNVDVKENLEKILAIFEGIGSRTTIIFPIHPRTRKMIREFGLTERFAAIPSLRLTDPIGYLDFLCLMDRAALLLTDSGGIQEETTFLEVPCLTLRENTERPITIEQGTNQLVGLDVERTVAEGLKALDGNGKRGVIPELWDGRAAERIVRILCEKMGVQE